MVILAVAISPFPNGPSAVRYQIFVSVVRLSPQVDTGAMLRGRPFSDYDYVPLHCTICISQTKVVPLIDRRVN